MKVNPHWMRQWICFGLVAALALASGCATHSIAPTVGEEHLAVPADAAERAYLGLSAEATRFELEDIRCEILLVDCFDMYCHICQSDAPRVNELYRLAQKRGLGERIKFVGLGVGDTPLEAATFQQKLGVPFPVFPDRHTVITRRFGSVRVPSLLVLRKRGGRLEVILRLTGALLDPAGVLAHLEAALTAAMPQGWPDAAQAAQPICNDRSPGCRSPLGREAGVTNGAPAAWE